MLPQEVQKLAQELRRYIPPHVVQQRLPDLIQNYETLVAQAVPPAQEIQDRRLVEQVRRLVVKVRFYQPYVPSLRVLFPPEIRERLLAKFIVQCWRQGPAPGQSTYLSTDEDRIIH
jgi:hypothetical protein